MSNRKSKLLQSLEDSMQPLDDDDVIRLIAHQIRQPVSDPIDLSRGKNADLSILHLEDAMKFRESMENFNISPTAESIDEVMPVKDQHLGEMLDVLNDFVPEHYDDDDDEVEEEDDDDYSDEYEEEEEDDVMRDRFKSFRFN
ncbi:calsequestrin-1 [Drosophila serrata]|uniref:calsequestrin-1 n=1 Tax=Drosophila serrata TaxID=7274 RepID=UPI000A1D0934|nr:calsequestrin-1 [Drosophila serrata]